MEQVKNITDVLDSADIEAVTRLVDSLNGSNCDFLQVEIGDMKVTIGKGEPPQSAKPAMMTPGAQASAPIAPAPAPAAVVAAPAAAAKPAAYAAPPAAAADGIAITASIMGRLYAKPEPGAEPFVTVGSVVDEGTTVGLIEVMKMFTPVLAGVRGVITEVCVADSDFVEFGQTLFRVKPQS
jgi:acetyl-CoA carboxylase biotin carboxyl carrier protein